MMVFLWNPSVTTNIDRDFLAGGEAVGEGEKGEVVVGGADMHLAYICENFLKLQFPKKRRTGGSLPPA